VEKKKEDKKPSRSIQTERKIIIKIKRDDGRRV
jgi:hypothetical protein